MSPPAPLPLRLPKARTCGPHLGGGEDAGLACSVCGAPRAPSRREACSNVCRAALSRRRRVEVQRKRDAEVLAVVDGIARLCGLLKKRLETS
jgi:predicted nucleic acid-binding Zn ribbon protein